MSKRKRKGGSLVADANGAGPSTSSSMRSVRQRGTSSVRPAAISEELPTLSDVHRAFLQQLMASLVLSSTKCKKLLKDKFYMTLNTGSVTL